MVILASDHGHVWHRDAAITRAEDASARWRPADGPVRDGEVLLEGGRVRGPGDIPRLIATWAEEVRYGTARNGYHGGASPREMVAPLVILADATAREPVPEPREPRPLPWWDGPGEVRRPEPVRYTPPTAPSKPRRSAGYLFPLEPAEVEPEPVASPGEDAVPAVAGWLDRTAGGKTEAAFFPLISQAMAGGWAGLSTLYISPIKALLNNQQERLGRYYGLVGRRAAPWHGDVPATARSGFWTTRPTAC